MKKLLLKLAFWILNRYEINYFIYPSEEKQARIEQLMLQVESKYINEEGAYKRHQVLRAALNALPDMSESDIAFAIELIIQRNKNVPRSR